MATRDSIEMLKCLMASRASFLADKVTCASLSPAIKTRRRFAMERGRLAETTLTLKSTPPPCNVCGKYMKNISFHPLLLQRLDFYGDVVRQRPRAACRSKPAAPRKSRQSKASSASQASATRSHSTAALSHASASWRYAWCSLSTKPNVQKYGSAASAPCASRISEASSRNSAASSSNRKTKFRVFKAVPRAAEAINRPCEAISAEVSESYSCALEAASRNCEARSCAFLIQVSIS